MDNRIEIRPGRTINIKTFINPAVTDTAFLIHGLGGRGDQWHEQINALKHQYNLVIPDLLGHGKSDKPKINSHNPYSFTELDLDLQALFKKYATEKNIILGHSYGGAMATSLAFDHQDDVQKLILLAPTPCAPSIEIPVLFKLPLFMMELCRPLLERDFQQRAFAPGDDAKLIEEEINAGKANPMYVISGMICGMRDIPALDVTMLTAPTLIMLGNKDKLVTPESSKRYYYQMPHHQFETINNASHLMMLEQPNETNKLISEFLVA